MPVRVRAALMSQRTLMLIKIEERRLASTPAQMSYAASTGRPNHSIPPNFPRPAYCDEGQSGTRPRLAVFKLVWAGVRAKRVAEA